MLRSIEVQPLVCPPWRLRGLLGEDGFHPIGDTCGRCGRDVARLRSCPAGEAICLYCAMNAGLVDLVEVEPDDDQHCA